MVFTDDILVYLSSQEKYAQHLHIMVQTLWDYKLYAKFSKCAFLLESDTFSSHVVSGEGISMDLAKVEAIRSWPRPTSMMEIWSFIGLAGYYRWFVEGLSTIVVLLTRLTHQGVPFVWSDKCEASF